MRGVPALRRTPLMRRRIVMSMLVGTFLVASMCLATGPVAAAPLPSGASHAPSAAPHARSPLPTSRPPHRTPGPPSQARSSPPPDGIRGRPRGVLIPDGARSGRVFLQGGGRSVPRGADQGGRPARRHRRTVSERVLRRLAEPLPPVRDHGTARLRRQTDRVRPLALRRASRRRPSAPRRRVRRGRSGGAERVERPCQRPRPAGRAACARERGAHRGSRRTASPTPPRTRPVRRSASTRRAATG